jgi:hypothetical protein
MRVTVPAGVSGEQTLRIHVFRIEVPGQCTLQVSVPAGLGPGSVFQNRTE